MGMAGWKADVGRGQRLVDARHRGHDIRRIGNGTDLCTGSAVSRRIARCIARAPLATGMTTRLMVGCGAGRRVRHGSLIDGVMRMAAGDARIGGRVVAGGERHRWQRQRQDEKEVQKSHATILNHKVL